MSNKYIDDYISYRVSIDKASPEKVKEWIKSDLNYLAPNDERMQGLICKQSLDNNWKGLYKLKQIKTNNSFHNFSQRNDDLNELVDLIIQQQYKNMENI